MTFDNDKCDVIYNGWVILRGLKDPASDLWTLPISPVDMQTSQSRSAPLLDRALHVSDEAPHPAVDLASFTHSVRTRANGVKFAHQCLCSPKISTLLKAVRRGFLRGCPNLSKKLILKYLNPSPATSKGHMKRPRHGIRSTRHASSPPSSAHPTFYAGYLSGATSRVGTFTRRLRSTTSDGT